MAYMCQTCGVISDDCANLCHPKKENVQMRFCGTPAIDICMEKIPEMRYACDACGSVSSRPENLCSPSEVIDHSRNPLPK